MPIPFFISGADRMNNIPIARVIMLKDGSVHLALSNRQTVLCTNHSILALFADPFGFIENDFKKYSLTTRDLNIDGKNLNDISGFTLAIVYADKSIKCEFPELFLSAKEAIFQTAEKPIHFKDYSLKTNFTDNKEYLLSLYLNLVNQPYSETHLTRKIPVSPVLEERMLKEVINTHMSSLEGSIDMAQILIEKTVSTESILKEQELNLARNKVTIKEYAKARNLTSTYVQTLISRNKMASAVKVNGRWYLDPNDEPIDIDRRANRKSKTKTEFGKRQITIQGSSYEDVQEYIAKRKLFTVKTAPFIRTYEEAKYYEKNNYHEVEWDGQLALIIDIKPDYYCESKGKTNREIILEGGSPVVPGDDSFVFHIHHIGQLVNSPFAIIPEQVHNSKELYSIFHSHSSGEANLHTKEFEMQKKAFWNNYLRYYDAYSGFSKIPFNNSKHTKHKR